MYGKDNVEGDAGIAEGVETNQRFFLRRRFHGFAQHSVDFFQRDCLDLFQIAVIGDGSGNDDGYLGAGEGIIGNNECISRFFGIFYIILYNNK